MSKKKAFVVGANVSKSLSPTIFNYWFNKYKIDAEYGYIEIEEESFDNEIKLILKEKDLIGLNITMPYKEKIIPHLMINTPQSILGNENMVLSDSAKKIGAVNWIYKKSNDKDKWIGGNSDWFGFKKSIELFPGLIEKKRNTAIIIGYGGAAKAIIYSLCFMKYKIIKIFNRSIEKINDKIFNTFQGAVVELHKLEQLEKHTHNASLIINATPINILNKSKEWNISPNTVGFDVVYRPKGGTGFLNQFEPQKRVDGIYMLVNQATSCFNEWFINHAAHDALIDEDLIKLLFNKMKENK